jgi:hypothetical protein
VRRKWSDARFLRSIGIDPEDYAGERVQFAVCEPNAKCAAHILCQRCGLCVGHCVCPPLSLRGNDRTIDKIKVRKPKSPRVRPHNPKRRAARGKNGAPK